MSVEKFNLTRINLRSIDELIGIIKGVASDGIIMEEEVKFLIDWMQANPWVQKTQLACTIYPRLIAAVRDKKIDAEEEREILDLLLKAVGNNSAQKVGQSSNSSKLPLCQPQPSLTVKNKVFCFTGKIQSGNRNWCEQSIIEHGGLISKKNITQDLDYLVIGEISTPSWKHSTYGNKIEAAVEYREKYNRLSIISEEHWISHMNTLTK
jgi:NAD-dependent DNA ligase